MDAIHHFKQKLQEEMRENQRLKQELNQAKLNYDALMAAIKQKQEKNLDEYRKPSIDGGGGEIPFLGLADPVAMEIDENSRSSSEGRNHDEHRPDLEMEMAAYKDERANHQPHIQPSSFSFSLNGFQRLFFSR